MEYNDIEKPILHVVLQSVKDLQVIILYELSRIAVANMSFYKPSGLVLASRSAPQFTTNLGDSLSKYREHCYNTLEELVIRISNLLEDILASDLVLSHVNHVQEERLKLAISKKRSGHGARRRPPGTEEYELLNADRFSRKSHSVVAKREDAPPSPQRERSLFQQSVRERREERAKKVKELELERINAEQDALDFIRDFAKEGGRADPEIDQNKSTLSRARNTPMQNEERAKLFEENSKFQEDFHNSHGVLKNSNAVANDRIQEAGVIAHTDFLSLPPLRRALSIDTELDDTQLNGEMASYTPSIQRERRLSPGHTAAYSRDRDQGRGDASNNSLDSPHVSHEGIRRGWTPLGSSKSRVSWDDSTSEDTSSFATNRRISVPPSPSRQEKVATRGRWNSPQMQPPEKRPNSPFYQKDRLSRSPSPPKDKAKSDVRSSSSSSGDNCREGAYRLCAPSPLETQEILLFYTATLVRSLALGVDRELSVIYRLPLCSVVSVI